MTVTLGVGLIIGIAVIVLLVLSGALELFTERTRRQTQRERWRDPNGPSQPQ